MDCEQLRTSFVVPVLKGLLAWSQEAEDLMIGTFAQESCCGKYIKQVGGPALGFWQMEPATHDDIWRNYMQRNSRIAHLLLNDICKLSRFPTSDLLLDNIRYACAMARVHYMRFSKQIPNTLEEQAAYWKQYYNTKNGKGDVDEYIANFNRFTNKKPIKQARSS